MLRKYREEFCGVSGRELEGQRLKEKQDVTKCKEEKKEEEGEGRDKMCVSVS